MNGLGYDLDASPEEHSPFCPKECLDPCHGEYDRLKGSIATWRTFQRASQASPIHPGLARKLTAAARHDYVGRLDQRCHLCGYADRHPLHSSTQSP